MLKLYKRQINNEISLRTIQLKSILDNQFFPAGNTGFKDRKIRFHGNPASI